MKIVIVSKGNINTRVKSLLFLLENSEFVELEMKNILELRKANDKMICVYDDIYFGKELADGKGYLLNNAKLISIAMSNPSEICDIHIYDKRVRDEIYIIDKSEITGAIKEYAEEGDFV